ncbi:MAG: hypothetical protein FWF80_06580 [Defluviitaleaceae bacterium]|nr:hypothetical protein [Defluviitaleaceae bacterium]
MEKLKNFVIVFATCSLSAIAGFTLGYFVFGAIDVSAAGGTKMHVEARFEDPEFVAQKLAEEHAPVDPEHTFVITSRDGAMVVYSAGEEAEVHDIAVDALPEADRARLEHGIFADTEDELVRILEDYGS